MEKSAAAVGEYGFDGLKLDSCSQFNNLTWWAELLNKTGRHILIENCHQGGLNPPGNPITNGDTPGSSPPYVNRDHPGPDNTQGDCSGTSAVSTCPYNLYRTSGDINPSFGHMMGNLNTVVRFLIRRAVDGRRAADQGPEDRLRAERERERERQGGPEGVPQRSPGGSWRWWSPWKHKQSVKNGWEKTQNHKQRQVASGLHLRGGLRLPAALRAAPAAWRWQSQAACGRPNCHFRRFGSLCNVAGGIKMGVWACFSGAPPRFSPFCTHFLPFFYSLACPYYCAACCPGASSRPHFRPKKRPPGSHFAPKTRFFDETSRGQYFSNNQRITTPCSKNMSKS